MIKGMYITILVHALRRLRCYSTAMFINSVLQSLSCLSVCFPYIICHCLTLFSLFCHRLFCSLLFFSSSLSPIGGQSRGDAQLDQGCLRGHCGPAGAWEVCCHSMYHTLQYSTVSPWYGFKCHGDLTCTCGNRKWLQTWLCHIELEAYHKTYIFVSLMSLIDYCSQFLACTRAHTAARYRDVMRISHYKQSRAVETVVFLQYVSEFALIAVVQQC